MSSILTTGFVRIASSAAW